MSGDFHAKQAIFLPTALQAFIVTADFPHGQARVAPLVQPNYTALRSDSNLLKHDVLDQLNLSSTRLKARFNTRFVNVAAGEVYHQRVGVYLAWCLPRLYRIGSTATDLLASDEAVLAYEKTLLRAGFISHTGEDDTLEAGNLKFHHAPNRWLVFRIVQPESDPQGQRSEIFVVESDRIRNVNDDDLRTWKADIDNLTSPFIHKGLAADQQHEAVLGLKAALRDYQPPDHGHHRQPFTVLDWGNEFFADYQPHNASVFSLFDDLAGIDEAKVTYYVVGFHHKIRHDSFTIDEPDLALRPTYRDLLSAGQMDLDPALFTGELARDSFLNQVADVSTRAICHGALRDLKFERGGRSNPPLVPTLIQPAITLQQNLLKAQPIAVGANIMDALLAYLRVHYHAPAAAKTFHAIDDTLSKIVQLIARTSNFEAQQQAEDEIAANDWVAEKAELMWTFSNSDDAQHADPGVVDPSDEDKRTLMALNSWQTCIAGCQREIRHLHHRLFTCWWKAMEAEPHPQKETIRKAIRSDVEAHAKRLDLLKARAQEAGAEIEQLKRRVPASLHLQTAATPAFGTHQDPTILFAGVKSGWPTGYREPLKVRHSSQLPAPKLDGLIARLAGREETKEWQSHLSKKFPLVADMIKKVLPEAIKADAAGPGYPLSYYAEAKSNHEAFNNTQGWFPLFMEWEVEYYHIGWEHWRFADGKDGDRRYRLRDDKPLKDIPSASECRTLHGRSLFLPQASQTLKTRIQQLFTRLHPKDLGKQIKEADQAKVLKLVSELEFFSTPLSGVREHMLTLMKGSHVGLSPYDHLAREGLGMKDELVMDVSEAAELAPYGKTQRLPTEYTFCPFKPVTHGQFRFTRLDIIDKFGQVVNAIEPADVDLGQPATALYPCVSPLFCCDPIPQDAPFDKQLPRPNTAVIPGDLRGVCQFFQVPPRINQPARLNGTHVLKDQGRYRPASAWENPIWAWLVVNYCDSSLQIFNPDGQFVQEIFIHPDSKTAVVSTRPKPSAWTPSSARLESFMTLCTDYEYARGFFSMVTEAAQSTGSNPSERADFLPAAFGDVLCCVDFGVSIELAGPPYENQSTQRPGNPAPLLEDYKFHIVFGSKNAAYDGFVGYYDLKTGMRDICSAFGVPRAKDDSKSPIVRPQPLTMQPYYIKPETPNYGAEQDARLSVFGAIVDPFRPLHVYTGDVFPMKEITIPQWALDRATKEMHAFFLAGPMLVPYVPELHLGRIGPAEDSAREAAIQTPLTGLDEWAWLHPKPKLDQNQKPIPNETDWTTMPIRPFDVQLNLSPSANRSEVVDGFFMMKKSVKEARPGGGGS